MTEQKKISRRTVAKGVAWSVPVVAVAAAAPAMAATSLPEPCVKYALGGEACKWPGSGNNWSYHLVLEICNQCEGDVTVNFTIDSLTNNAGKPFTPCSDDPLPLTVNETIAQGECVQVPLGDFSSESSAGWVVGYDASETKLFEVQASSKVGDCAFDNPCAP